MATWLGWNRKPEGSTQCNPGVSGSVNLFGRGDDGVVYHSGLPTGNFDGPWSPWVGLYGLTTSHGPATTVQGGSVYAFAVNDDRRVSYTRWNGSGADGWHEIPGSETMNSPAVAPGVIVVRRADDNTLRYNTFDGSGSVLSWGNWHTIDGIVATYAPAITDFGGGYVLVAESGSKLFYRDLGSDRSSWGQWNSVPGGGQTYDAPAMAKSMLVVRGTDNALHWKTYDGGLSWTEWQSAGGTTYSAPALAHSGSYFTLVVRGTDNAFHYMFYS